MSSFDPQSEWQEAPSADKFEELKRLLLADEHSLITKLTRRLESVEDAQQVVEALHRELAEVNNQKISREEFETRLGQLGLDVDQLTALLPQAVRRATKSSDELSTALGPTLANAFQDSVRKNPQALADAVSPIMGPAIRRSISQAINSMIQSLSRTLDHTVSAKGLRWRWEAMTTGKPFAEVVLLHSMRFIVEHVFLIRKEDGIVLQHVSSLPAKSTNADLVSGMLTALQDFVRDSLGGTEADHLEDLRVGDREIWIEHGSQAILAAVIRGHASPDLRSTLQDVSERIHSDYQQTFQEFAGDTDDFSSAEDDLRECLAFAYREEEQQKQKIWPVATALICAGLLSVAALIWWGMRWHHRDVVRQIISHLAPPATVDLELQKGVLTVRGEAHDEWIRRAGMIAPTLSHVQQLDLEQLTNLDANWLTYVEQLRGRPGLVVTRAQRRVDDQYSLEVLRDPLAADPMALLEEFELSTEQVVITTRSFQSDEADFPLRRARSYLDTEPTVRWDLQDRVLTASGRAPHEWLQRARLYAEQHADLDINLNDVVDADARALEESRQQVERLVIRHEDGSADLTAESEAELDSHAREISQLIERADAMGETIHIVVMAYADREESAETPPQTLSDRRARLVWRELIRRAVPERHLMIRALGTGSAVVSDSDLTNDRRRSQFDVRFGSD